MPSADAATAARPCVPADGEPRAVPLPRARERAAGRVRGCPGWPARRCAGRTRLVSTTTPRRPSGGEKLGPLCDWAWTAAIGPLLERGAARRAGRSAAARARASRAARRGPVARRPLAGEPGLRLAVRRRRRRVLLRGLRPSARGGQPPSGPPAGERPGHRGTARTTSSSARSRRRRSAACYPGARYLGFAVDGQADGPARPRGRARRAARQGGTRARPCCTWCVTA